jgi:hypothetical protein
VAEVFLPARETETSRVEKTINRLSKENGISPHWTEHLTLNQSLYVSRQGALTFIRRDTKGYATGYVYENGYQPEDERGFFYVGNPKTAKHFIIAETPKEVLAILELTGHRNLSEVCVVASDKKRPPIALTRLLKELSLEKPVRIVWALGLNREHVQIAAHFEELQIELVESRPEKAPPLDFFSWQPNPDYGLNWNSQIQLRNLPGELHGIAKQVLITDQQIIEPVDETQTKEYYAQVAASFKNIEIKKVRASENDAPFTCITRLMAFLPPRLSL